MVDKVTKRGRKPGTKKTGGRKKGTPNKKTQEVIDRLEAMGCDPIRGMAEIAMDVEVDISVRASMYRELAQYVAPKRKAIEVTGANGGPIKHEEWLAELG